MPQMHCATTRAYEVSMVNGVFDSARTDLVEAVGSRRGLVVLDSNVAAQHGRAVRDYLDHWLPDFAIHELHCSEHDKTMASVLEICSAAHQHDLGRRDALVAVGGGICCDLVSVAASLVRRGLPYVMVPTTLVGQVDAGIAVKGGVNFEGHKNYLGCFWPPSHVLVDTGLLATVRARDLRSGLAEMVKIALVRDGGMFHELRAHGSELVRTGFAQPKEVGQRLVERAIALMLSELSANPFEQTDLRRLVDFGHTVSGTLEERSDYGVRHGEAVAIDMALSAALAAELGLLSETDLEEILGTLVELGLPVWTPMLTEAVLLDAINATVRHRAGALNLVVPTGLGAGTFLSLAAVGASDALAVARRRVATFAATHRVGSPAPDDEADIDLDAVAS